MPQGKAKAKPKAKSKAKAKPAKAARQEQRRSVVRELNELAAEAGVEQVRVHDLSAVPELYERLAHSLAEDQIPS